MTDLRPTILRPMTIAAGGISAVCGTGDLVQSALGPTSDPLMLAGLGWFAMSLSMGVVHLWVRAGRLTLATRAFLTLCLMVLFGISMLESPFGSVLLLTLGPLFVALSVFGLLPEALHTRWTWALGGGTTLGLLCRHALRPMPGFADTAELVASSMAAGLAVYAISRLGEGLIDHAVRSSTRSIEALADLERSNTALVLSRDRALAASRAKAAFLANMSHELRTPLNAILGYVELVQEDLQDADAGITKDLDSVALAARHLLATISEILDLSRIEAGQVDMALRIVALDELTDQVQRLMQPVVAEGGNTLHVEGAEGTFRTDAQRLRQVLVNLVGNAAKFTRDGRITLRIRPGSRADREGLSLEVEDTGIGIAPDRLEAIFEPFHTSVGGSAGSGIGLTVSRAFVERLGGTLTVRSRPGVGSTFTVWLPERHDGAELLSVGVDPVD